MTDQMSFEDLHNWQRGGEFHYDEPIPESVATYRLGGRLYPLRSEPRCHTCQSPYRMRVEKGLLRGYSYRAIAESLPSDAHLNASHIRRHVRSKHMPLDENVRRVAIEERARELGHDVESHDQMLADHVTLARVGVQRVFERMQDGELEPDISDGIAFANLLAKLGIHEESAIDEQMLFEILGAYMEAAVEVMDADQQREFANRLGQHPVLQRMVGDVQERAGGAREAMALEVSE